MAAADSAARDAGVFPAAAAPAGEHRKSERFQHLTALEHFHARAEVSIGPVTQRVMRFHAVGWRGDCVALPLPDPLPEADNYRVKALFKTEAAMAEATARPPPKQSAAASTAAAEGTAKAPPGGGGEACDAYAPWRCEPLPTKAVPMGQLQRATAAGTLVARMSPGLLTVFNEILQNAMDRTAHDETFTEMRVDIDVRDRTAPIITIFNNGVGMQVRRLRDEELQEHERGGAECDRPWLPSKLFSEFNFGSNFDSERVRGVGGRNGKGAKLTNATATWFKIRVVDGPNARVFAQTWENLGKTQHPPVIRAARKSDVGGVRVQWAPQLAFFGMTSLDARSTTALKSAVWSAAAVLAPRVKVVLDGIRLPLPSLARFAGLLLPTPKGVHEDTVCDGEGQARLRITVSSAAKYGMGTLRGFVNGLSTDAGGHVDLVLQALTRALSEALGEHLTPKHVRALCTIVVVANVDYPRFESNVKACLDMPPRELGVTWTPPAAMVEAVRAKAGPLLTALQSEKEAAADILKANRMLAAGVTGGTAKDKAVGRVANDARARALRAARDTPKYTAAAGLKPGCSAQLILCEGESAASMAKEGRSVRGTAEFSTLVMRGKVLNVRGVSLAKVAENPVISQIATALGIKFGQQVKSLKELCHAGVILMTDQDEDGLHIAGLVYNAIAHLWPSILVLDPTYVKIFTTPLWKAWVPTRRGGGPKATGRAGRSGSVISFKSQAAWKAWSATQPKSVVEGAKRYKGLGTHGQKEQREYFRDMHLHIMGLHHGQPAPEGELPPRPRAAASGAGAASDADTDGDAESDGDSVVSRGTWQELPDVAPDASLEDLSAVDTEQALGVFFEKQSAACRARAFAQYDPEASMRYDLPVVPTAYWLKQGCMAFPQVANVRHLPHVVDGLKRVQRQVLWAILAGHALQGKSGEDKVDQVAAAVSRVTHYNHGVKAMQDTIRDMAKWYTGRQNLPLIEPRGNVGDRSSGMDVAARYLDVALSGIARAVFPPEDMASLPRLSEDGHAVEAAHLVPVVPYALWVPVTGLGWGHRCLTHPYNWRDLIAAVRAGLEHSGPEASGGQDAAAAVINAATPWYDGFIGTVSRVEEVPHKPSAKRSQWLQRGVYYVGALDAVSNTRVVEVRELPTDLTVAGWLEGLKKIVAPSGSAVREQDTIDADAAVERAAHALEQAREAHRTAAERVRQRPPKTPAATLRGLRAAAKAASASVKEAERAEKAAARQQAALRKHLIVRYENLSTAGWVHVRVHLDEYAAAPLLAEVGEDIPAWTLPYAEGHTCDSRTLQGMPGRGEHPPIMRVYPRLETALRLVKPMRCEYKMWSADGSQVLRLSGAGEVLRAWWPVRAEAYVRRRADAVQRLERIALEARNRARYMRAVVAGELSVVGVSDTRALHQTLVARGFASDAALHGGETETPTFKYLAGIRAVHLTLHHADEADAAAARAEAAAATMTATTPRQLWLRDLDALQASALAMEETKRRAFRVDGVLAEPTGGKKRGRARGAAAKGRKTGKRARGQ